MLSTLTPEFIEDLYANSWGNVATAKIHNIQIVKNSAGLIYLELAISVDKRDTEALREAARVYLKPYLQKGEKLTCWLNTYTKTLKLACEAYHTRPFRPELQNKSLELLLEKLSSTI